MMVVVYSQDRGKNNYGILRARLLRRRLLRGMMTVRRLWLLVGVGVAWTLLIYFLVFGFCFYLVIARKFKFLFMGD